jgi:flagellin-specific chaperone FliS
MLAHESYKQNSNQWTRIDMLLDLLRATQQCIEQVLQATRDGQNHDAFRLKSRALVLIGGLQSGVDQNGAELTEKVNQLYEYMQHCLVQGDEQMLDSALRVLQELVEGFEGIREDAIRLEQTGDIPPVTDSPMLDASC